MNIQKTYYFNYKNRIYHSTKFLSFSVGLKIFTNRNIFGLKSYETN
jgi:hypothetical protein